LFNYYIKVIIKKRIKIGKKKQNRNGDKIVFGSDIQDKVIVLISCLVVDVQEKIKYKKIYFTFNIY
jgi:hypothetical protein